MREAAPGATFTLGTDPSQIIVWARPKDHETIKQLVEQLDEKVPPEKAAKLVVYTFNEKTAADRLEAAVAETVAEGKSVTYDLRPGRDVTTAVGTSEMADTIIARLK